MGLGGQESIGAAAAQNCLAMICRDTFGPDVAYMDQALHHVFERYSIDPGRIGLAGFSDGASYALSLGVANGDLFTHIMAFSPGFMRPPAQVMNHGRGGGVKTSAGTVANIIVNGWLEFWGINEITQFSSTMCSLWR